MSLDLCGLPHYWIAIIMIVVLCVEAWLGKTDKTQAGSILELIFIAVIGAVIKLVWKGKP